MKLEAFFGIKTKHKAVEVEVNVGTLGDFRST